MCMEEFIFLFSYSVGDHPTILLVVLLFLPCVPCDLSLSLFWAVLFEEEKKK